MQYCHDIFRLSQILLSSVEKILGQCSPFPPEVFLDARSHGRHEVVEVHDDVDTHVEEPAEGGVSATNKPANIFFIVSCDQPLQIFAHCKLKIIKF